MQTGSTNNSHHSPPSINSVKNEFDGGLPISDNNVSTTNINDNEAVMNEADWEIAETDTEVNVSEKSVYLSV